MHDAIVWACGVICGVLATLLHGYRRKKMRDGFIAAMLKAKHGKEATPE